MQIISAKEASTLLNTQKGSLVDVRTPAEFQELHAEGAKLLPLDQFDPAKASSTRSDGSPLVLICKSGSRSKMAYEKAQSAGIQNLYMVDGGTLAWEQAGLPVKRGVKVMSLERQVRIAAGSIVFVGSLLTYFVHHYFIGIPAFVGAGLVFAGLTDTCGMGMVISRMPWNQRTLDPACVVQ